jgi:hypothetical protein
MRVCAPVLLCCSYDTDGSNTMDMGEFLKLMSEYYNERRDLHHSIEQTRWRQVSEQVFAPQHRADAVATGG